MITCQECRNEFWPSQHGDAIRCPRCWAEVKAESPQGMWTAVARTTNLAEAGYLTNDLVANGHEARIEQHDSFSAIDGNWQSIFLVQVPTSSAEAATERVRLSLAEEDHPTDAEAIQFESEHEPTVIWRPLALMAVAGVAIFFVGYRMRELRAPQPQPGPTPTLLRTLEKINRPMLTERRPGERGYRIRFEPGPRRWHLEEDIDGDGSYDRAAVFVEE